MMKQGLLKANAEMFLLFAKLLDLVLIACAGYLAFLIRFDLGQVTFSQYQIAILVGVLVSCFFVFSHKNYQPLRGRSVLTILLRVFWFCLLWLFIMAFIALLTKTGGYYSRAWVLQWAALNWLLLSISRLLLLIGFRVLRRKGYNQRRAIVIGAGQMGLQFVRRARRTLWAGTQIVDMFDDDESLHGKRRQGVVISALPNDLAALVEQKGIDIIYLSLPISAEARIQEILHQLRFSTASIKLLPDLFGAGLLNHGISEFLGLPMIDLRETPMQGGNRIIKWLEDKLLASLILICISPILLVVSILIKFNSPGPIFYRQERVSWNNKTFTMLKFRSMPVGAESQTGAVWAKEGEQRATKLGAFLRRTSLDELPQFINVLKGDMSIVGPRPERPVFVNRFKHEVPGYMQKHLVKAGITGWAQVNGLRGNTSLKKRIEYDLDYIQRWSLAFDLQIIGMTFLKGFINKNAY